MSPSSPGEGPGSRDSPLVPPMAELRPVRSQSPSGSLACSRLRSGRGCAAAPRPALGPRAAMQRDPEGERLRDKHSTALRVSLSFHYITLGLGGTRHSFKIIDLFPNPLWACSGPSPNQFHLFLPLMVAAWLLRLVCPAEAFSPSSPNNPGTQWLFPREIFPVSFGI